jgi:hypothetical protein
VGTKVLVHDGHEWARKCWSVSGMSGHESARPLKGMFDSPFTGTLTYVKSLAMVFLTACATVSERFAIADHFSFFW